MSKFYNALIRLVRFALPDMETVWEEPFDGLLPQSRRLLRPYRYVRFFLSAGSVPPMAERGHHGA